MSNGNGEHAAAAANGYPAKPHLSEPSPRSFQEVCHELKDKVDAFLEDDQKTDVLRNVQKQLRLVLLIILLAALARRYPSLSKASHTNGSNGTTSFPPEFQAVYIVSKHPFAEVDDFVETTSAEYHLDVKRYAMSMKDGLEAYLADRPNVKAIFVGTRRTDPHGEKLTDFDPTDSGWPAFMRVHPVIDWHYAEIWAFIRHLEIPYCPLYDQGYTSLGGTQDTHPNPQLKTEGQNGAGFRPAYELTEDDEERLGRDR
ncbi:phosphoadenosine phosphosulfate reductase [Colletotrichum salicis]|uniref:FAD synthase n=1 Tax=Colletotrichum salicis TaxID=1209931 RepID=A0A135V5X8_9PEZI|nr:phosphoadenosine phosphosulfate reductase [Colletotrichum salicis]